MDFPLKTQNQDSPAGSHRRFGQRFYWDWFNESPIEILIVSFTLLFFFLFPMQNCGITPYRRLHSDTPNRSVEKEVRGVHRLFDSPDDSIRGENH